MKLIAIGSAKSSPGVTATAMALAFTWPVDRSSILVEADVGGGDLIAKLNLSTTPNLVSMATTLRRDDRTVKADYFQEFDGVKIVPSLPSADQTRAAIGAIDISRMRQLDSETSAIIDCGRIDPSSASWSLVTAADVVVLCARPIVSELQHLVTLITWLGMADVTPVVVLSGLGDYKSNEVSDALGVEVLAHLPHDAIAASALLGGVANQKSLSRSSLLRSARQTAELLVEKLSSSEAGMAS